MIPNTRKRRKQLRTFSRTAMVFFIVLAVLIAGVMGIYLMSNQSTANENDIQEQSRTFSTAAFLSDTIAGSADGPVTVGLQVGHLENAAVPDELDALRGVSTGASGGGTTEVAVVSTIASLTADMLEEQGVVVDIIPATVPQDYYADAFVAIHTDGSESSLASGYKVVDSQLSLNNDSEALSQAIGAAYQETTQLREDDNITGNMKYYYAFNWMRFDHSVHPMTPAAILETGFITSYEDQRILIDQPELAAQGLADGILDFLQKEQLI